GDATPTTAERARLQADLGRVLYDDLGQADRGLAALRRALDLSKSDSRLRDELADRLMRAGHNKEAADELTVLLEGEPLRVELWQRLVEAFRGAGKKVLTDAALGPLVALGGGSDLDRVTVQTRARRSG